MSAATPFFEAVMYQATANHTVSGARVRWKMVPDVTDTWRRQALAPETPFPQVDTAASFTARTHEPVGPPQPRQVVEASVLVAEPRAQLRVAPREVGAGLKGGGGKLGRHHYILYPAHSDG